MKSFKEARQDPHRPSVLDPAEYVYVGCADDHDIDSYFEMDHQRLRQHGIDTGETNPHSAVGVPWYDATEDGRPNYRCHHCGKHGSNIRYFTFFLHKPNKVVVTVGQICAKKLNLGTKEELDLQKRADAFRKAQERNRWAHDFPDEYAYLAEYAVQRDGGWYAEFLSSLWERIQDRGELTGGQTSALRKWMGRGKPWVRISPASADRNQGHVTQTQDDPTEKQIDLIQKLGGTVVPATRLEASDLINTLKAQARAESPTRMDDPAATEKQLTLINKLMNEREIPTEKRQEARARIDAGISKRIASAYIARLLELPKLAA